MGSKNLIAKTLIDALPAATTFVDLFAGDFDHDAFYAWCMEQPFDIYISEYSMPTGFHEVLTIPHRSRLSRTSNNAVVERLYCNHPRQRFGQLDFLGQLFAEAV